MLVSFQILDDAEILEKAFRGPQPGHKYVARWRKNGIWRYKYRKTKAERHGDEHIGTKTAHSIEIHPDSNKHRQV